MNSPIDGGEAMLEGLRSLGIDYVMSSPGSEWGSFWEALARQTVSKTPGPTYLSCWHETLAANMALGYTLATGRMQAVVLHAGVGLLQGSVGIHAAYIQNAPMLDAVAQAGIRSFFDHADEGHSHRIANIRFKRMGRVAGHDDEVRA